MHRTTFRETGLLILHLLQSSIPSFLQNAISSATAFFYDEKQQFYYKMRKELESATIIQVETEQGINHR